MVGGTQKRIARGTDESVRASDTEWVKIGARLDLIGFHHHRFMCHVRDIWRDGFIRRIRDRNLSQYITDWDADKRG